MRHIVFNGTAVYAGTEYFKWSTDYALTVGKAYTFKNGKFADDNGKKCSCMFTHHELVGNGFVPQDNNERRCEVIPEGRQVCKGCEHNAEEA